MTTISTTSSGANVSEAIGGIVAVVLTILGLAHVVPDFLVAIATIAVGAALAFQGAAIAGQHARSGAQAGPGFGGSPWSIMFLAGIAGIVLGVLALLQVTPVELVAIAAITFGGALVLNGDAAALGAQALAGLAGVVLGILALAGFAPVVLVLIALLVLGAFILVSGATLNSMLLNMLGR